MSHEPQIIMRVRQTMTSILSRHIRQKSRLFLETFGLEVFGGVFPKRPADVAVLAAQRSTELMVVQDA
jgi:hypothetical protein